MIGRDSRKISRADAIIARFGVRPSWAAANARWRELARKAAGQVAARCAPGQIVLLTGSSGSGKSVLLGEVAAVLGGRAVVCQTSGCEDDLVVDCLPWLELENALEVLARFGLGEVYTYLSPAGQLSTGQRSRLRLAMGYARAVSGGDRIMLADEFGTQLDHFSAAVIARNLRRVVSADARIGAVVASCHEDLEKALRPDVVVTCDFGHYHSRGRDAEGT